MDGGFQKLMHLMPTVECNTTTAKEHVSKAERTIQMVKEEGQGLLTILPFEHIPKKMKIEFVNFIVLWLNSFPVKTGISSRYSPCELLVQWHMDYKKHCRVLPGTFCKVHNEPVLLNTMEPKTHEAIALGPTGNLQGSMKFYSLKMGRVLEHCSFTAMPCQIEYLNR